MAQNLFTQLPGQLLNSLKDTWNSLSPEERSIAGALALVDMAGKTVALWDLSRQDPSKVRGAKWAWAPAIGGINTLGWIAWFAFGKKR